MSAGAVCEENSDCANDTCGHTGFPRSSYPTKTCCQSGEGVYFNGGFGNQYDICASLPPRTPCGSFNEMCASGTFAVQTACVLDDYIKIEVKSRVSFIRHLSYYYTTRRYSSVL